LSAASSMFPTCDLHPPQCNRKAVYRQPGCLQSHMSSVWSAASLQCSLQYLPNGPSPVTEHLHDDGAYFVSQTASVRYPVS
jgi:hypothetical protein